MTPAIPGTDLEVYLIANAGTDTYTITCTVAGDLLENALGAVTYKWNGDTKVLGTTASGLNPREGGGILVQGLLAVAWSGTQPAVSDTAYSARPPAKRARSSTLPDRVASLSPGSSSPVAVTRTSPSSASANTDPRLCGARECAA